MSSKTSRNLEVSKQCKPWREWVVKLVIWLTNLCALTQLSVYLQLKLSTTHGFKQRVRIFTTKRLLNKQCKTWQNSNEIQNLGKRFSHSWLVTLQPRSNKMNCENHSSSGIKIAMDSFKEMNLLVATENCFRSMTHKQLMKKQLLPLITQILIKAALSTLQSGAQ